MSTRAASSGWLCLLAAAFTFLCLQGATAQQPFNLDDVTEGKSRQALIALTVRGTTQSGDSGENLGTAFFVSEDGLALTAAHLFYRDKNRYDIGERLNGPDDTFIKGQIGSLGNDNRKLFRLVDINPTLDVALIQLTDKDEKKVTFLKVCTEKPKTTDTLFLVGFEEKLGLHRREGKLLNGNLESNRYSVDISINPGMSGGPVIAPSGKVFAMGVSGVREQDVERLNYVLPMQLASEVLRQAKAMEDCAEGSRLSVQPPDVADRFLIYITYKGDQNLKLEQYRELLLSEMFGLSQSMRRIEPITKQEHQEVVLFNKISGEYLDGSGDATKLASLLRNDKQTLVDLNFKTLFLYVVRLQDLGDTIKARPLLLRLQASGTEFVSSNLKEWTAVRLEAKEFTTIKEHAFDLLDNLAEFKAEKFSQPVVFVNCIDDRGILGGVPWRTWATRQLALDLETIWNDPAQKAFNAYKGRLAYAGSCDRDPTARGGDRVFSLAQDKINAIISKRIDGVGGDPYVADWRKLSMGKQPLPGFPKTITSITEPQLILKTWVREITAHWFEDRP